MSQALAAAGRVVFHAAGSLAASELAGAKKLTVVGSLPEVRAAASGLNPTTVALLEDLKEDTEVTAGVQTETLVRAAPHGQSQVFAVASPAITPHCLNINRPLDTSGRLRAWRRLILILPRCAVLQFDPATKQRLSCVCVPRGVGRNTAPSRPDLVHKALAGSLAGSSVLIANQQVRSLTARPRLPACMNSPAGLPAAQPTSRMLHPFTPL